MSARDEPTRRPPRSALGLWLFAHATVLAVLAWLTYGRTLNGPFVFDDISGIVLNRSLDPGSGLAAAFMAPPESTPGGRPILNASLALNRRLFGAAPASFRAFNIILHAANGTLLALLIVMILRAAALDDRAAILTACMASLFWTLHPIQTESVAYIIQRAESLGTFFYLLALVFAFHHLRTPNGRLASLFLCAFFLLLGGLTKEINITVPLAVTALHVFIRRKTASRALDARWFRLMLFMALALAPMLLLNLFGAARQGSSGFSYEGITPWNYFRAQHAVFFHYLRLMFWPAPLAFDYAWPPPDDSPRSLFFSVLYFALLLAALAAFFRSKSAALCLLGAWITLLPTSTLIPIRDLAFEHRCYLALGWIAGWLALASGRWFAAPALPKTRAAFKPLAFILLALMTCALTAAAFERNHVYTDAFDLWTDTVRKRPANARARNNLGCLLAEKGMRGEAAAEFQTALALDPKYPEAWNNLGLEHVAAGRFEESRAAFQRAVELNPRYHDAFVNLGGSLMTLGRTDEGITAFEEACRLAPNVATHYEKLAMAWQIKGDMQSAQRARDEAASIRARNASP